MPRHPSVSRSLLPLAALAVCGLAAASSHAADAPAPAPAAPAAAAPAGKATHVLLMVWDGMRPDFINAEKTPNVYALAKRGTFFANNHSFWPTTTEVNGTVLATGTFPSRSTIVANKEFRPAIDPHGPVGTDDVKVMRKGDVLTGGHYIATRTIAEIVRDNKLSTAIAGTKPVALLHDRSETRPESPKNGVVFGGKTLPESLLKPIMDSLKEPFVLYKSDPTNPQPNTAGNNWTTQALLQQLWRDGVPRYSVLWLSDPDFPQHASAPGHKAALDGISDDDRNLGLVVEELKKRGEYDNTDIFVVSDHGFSTVGRQVDVLQYYTDHGLDVTTRFVEKPKTGQTLEVSVGGASALYVTDHDPATIAKLVDALQTSDFAGPIFTKNGLPGTFPLSLARTDSPFAADIVFSFRWDAGANANGIPGMMTAETKQGFGMHGSLGKFDTHNTLVAGGPDIRAGYEDKYPSGNIDVGATILHILGLTHPDGVDGRVLTEALAGEPAGEDKVVTRNVVVKRPLPNGAEWKQYLRVSRFRGKNYFDEGNVGE